MLSCNFSTSYAKLGKKRLDSVPTDFAGLLTLLAKGEIEFILVGGLAGVAHGAERPTSDVDVVYRRTDGNLKKLAAALKNVHPRLRGAPPDLPFLLDARTLRQGLNFTLLTDLGALDLLGEISGGGTYEMLEKDASPLDILGHKIKCLNLDKLIEVKRAAGRPKDYLAVAELEGIRDNKRRA